MTDITIDPNVRVANDETYAGFEDVVGEFPREGSVVTVREPESNLVGRGIVTRIDDEDQLIYIAVDWATLAPALILSPDQLVRYVAAAAHTLSASVLPHVETSPPQPSQLVGSSRPGALTAA